MDTSKLPVLKGKSGSYQITYPSFHFQRVDGSSITLVCTESITDKQVLSMWERKIQEGSALSMTEAVKDNGLAAELIAAYENDQAGFITKSSKETK